MISRKIGDLSWEDLTYLEMLLKNQYSAELEKDKTWESKNRYDRIGSHKNKIRRIMEAISSQKTLSKLDKW
tara:strand:+ start:1636 stop:1848 length:213 start_codon:yes stop_codon:yes gene_type:complete